jgi:hypothetical protein
MYAYVYICMHMCTYVYNDDIYDIIDIIDIYSSGTHSLTHTHTHSPTVFL